MSGEACDHTSETFRLGELVQELIANRQRREVLQKRVIRMTGLLEQASGQLRRAADLNLREGFGPGLPGPGGPTGYAGPIKRWGLTVVATDEELEKEWPSYAQFDRLVQEMTGVCKRIADLEAELRKHGAID